jgi:hypothetical protein
MREETFIPKEYYIFAGRDVDKRSISVTFADHHRLLKSLRMPYSVEHLVSSRAQALSRSEGSVCG